MRTQISRIPRFATLAVVVLSILGTPPPVAAQAPKGCADERSKQFDFWIGEWDVYAGETKAGTNSIRPILDGCVLQESWVGAGGSAGSSFNFFDPSRKTWRQLWVWRNGTTLELEGELVDRSMILSGESTRPDGTTILNRITWTPRDEGRVRQLWEQSEDGGSSWSTAFDGDYRPRR